jgi:putative transposase
MRYALAMARKTVFVPGEFYHLYNRGTEKRTVFSNQKEYARFIALLYLANSTEPIRIDNLPSAKQGETLLKMAIEKRPLGSESLVELAAYCLMPNHFHLLVREKVEGGISRFMQKLTTGYTMYFNKRHKRSGALFQGIFKSTHAGEDRYLKYLLSYIHLNPIKLIDSNWKEKGLKSRKQAGSFLNRYAYSSYLDYAGHDRIEQVLLDKKVLPVYFATPKKFKAEMFEWLDYGNEETA